MSVPLNSKREVEVKVVDFDGKMILESGIARYLALGFDLKEVFPYIYKTVERPAQFNYQQTEAIGFTAIFVKQSFTIETMVSNQIDATTMKEISKQMKRR